MTIIANTTPINHLALLDKADLLEKLYGRIVIPQAVVAELQAQGAPRKVRDWISKRPDWLEVRHVTVPPDPRLASLDAGEREAILLAEELGADMLLMDDLGGRREAKRRGLNATGTLTVLFLAAQRGLVEDFPGTLRQLQRTGFRASSELVQLFLDRHAERPPQRDKKRR